IADITTDQSIHWRRTFHVRFYLAQSTKLILCLDIWERSLKLMLPVAVLRVSKTIDRRPLCVKFKQFARLVLGGLACACSDSYPVLLTEPIKRWRPIIRPDVTRKPVGLLNRDIDGIAAAILDCHIFAGNVVESSPDDPAKTTDSVVDMIDIVAFRPTRIVRFRQARWTIDAAAALL